jgi:hypothetical protein
VASEPHEYRARIKAKGADGTGITREHAKHMALNQGKHTLLIVEVEHDRLVKEVDGSQQINLAITSVEPVPAEQEDTVRRFMRALYMTRPEVAGQSTLQGTAEEETPEQAAAALDAAVTTDDTGEVSGVWDGDPDSPLPEAPAAGLSAVPDEEDRPETCPFPECKQDAGHDGPHRDGAGHIIGSDAEDAQG